MKIILDIANLYILFVKTAKIVYIVIIEFVPTQPSQIKYILDISSANVQQNRPLFYLPILPTYQLYQRRKLKPVLIVFRFSHPL